MKYKLLPLLTVALALTVILSPNSLHAQNLFITDAGSRTVKKFNASGTGTVFASFDYPPCGLAFDTRSNLYVAYYLGIQKIDPSGNGTLFATSGIKPRSGLAIDGGDNVYVANISANTIDKFDSAGHGTIFASTNLNGPMGLAFDGSGNLFVANNGNNTIAKFSPSGNGTIFASSGLHGPVGLAIDSSGNVYEADNSYGQILKITSNGINLGAISVSINAPYGLAFDSNGNLFAADYMIGAIKELIKTNGTLSGTPVVFASSVGNPTYLAFQPRAKPILQAQRSGANVVLTWTDSSFSLQAAPAITGTYTNVPGAANPCTNAIIGSKMFFRLSSN